MLRVKGLVWMLGCILFLLGCVSSDKNDLLTDIDVEIVPVLNIQHSSNSPMTFYSLGRYYQRVVNYEKAIEAYETALAGHPDYVEAHNALGVIYSKQGRYDLAVQHFRKAIGIAPAASYLHNNIGYAYLVQGKETEAVEALRLALQFDPGNKQAQQNLEVAFERVRLYERELELILEHVSLYEKSDVLLMVTD